MRMLKYGVSARDGAACLSSFRALPLLRLKERVATARPPACHCAGSSAAGGGAQIIKRFFGTQQFIFFFLLSVNCAFAQRIINFNLYPTGTLIGIKFTVTAGKDCGGYKIWHSTDSLNFSVIEDYAGICGNSNSDDTKNFTHNSPVLNQKNYYKVVLATSESSVVRSVYISSSNSDAVKAFPNPIDANNPVLNCRVTGSGTSKLKAIIYGQSGKIIREMDVFSKSDIVSMDVSNLRNGLYVLEIANGDKPYTTKFLIHH